MADVTQLMGVGAEVDWPDSEAGSQTRNRLAARRGLGHLVGLAEWMVEVRPAHPDDRTVLVVVTDAPADAEAHPDRTVAETAAEHRVDVRTVAAGDTTEQALAAGVALADELAETGIDLLIVAVPEGDGDTVTTDSAVVVSVLTNTEPAKVLARGVAATDPDAWMAMAAGVRDRRRVCMTHRDDPDALLAAVGSPQLALAAGLLLQSAVRRTPTVIDGPGATAAALIAYEAQPRAVRWWAAADEGDQPLQEMTLTRLGRRPVLALGTGLGDGLAGVLAVPLLRAAARVAAEPEPGPDAASDASPDAASDAASDAGSAPAGT